MSSFGRVDVCIVEGGVFGSCYGSSGFRVVMDVGLMSFDLVNISVLGVVFSLVVTGYQCQRSTEWTLSWFISVGIAVIH